MAYGGVAGPPVGQPDPTWCSTLWRRPSGRCGLCCACRPRTGGAARPSRRWAPGRDGWSLCGTSARRRSCPRRSCQRTSRRPRRHLLQRDGPILGVYPEGGPRPLRVLRRLCQVRPPSSRAPGQRLPALGGLPDPHREGAQGGRRQAHRCGRAAHRRAGHRGGRRSIRAGGASGGHGSGACRRRTGRPRGCPGCCTEACACTVAAIHGSWSSSRANGRPAR